MIKKSLPVYEVKLGKIAELLYEFKESRNQQIYTKYDGWNLLRNSILIT